VHAPVRSTWEPIDPPFWVRSPEAALQVVLVLSRHVAGGFAVVALDDDGALLTGAWVAPPERTPEEACAEFLAHAPPVVGAVLLATLDADGGVAEISEDGVASWRALRSLFGSAGVELLDWFLVEDGAARSMAATAGEAASW
jgi:hypothetical protein